MRRARSILWSYPVLLLGAIPALVNGFSLHSLVSYITRRTASSALYQEPQNESQRPYTSSPGLPRRTLLTWGIFGGAAMSGFPSSSAAIATSMKPLSLFVVPTKNTTSVEGLQKETVDIDTADLSSEICLLKLLPVKNSVFRQLETYIMAVSILRPAGATEASSSVWKELTKKMQMALNFLDSKRSRLEPVFNQDDSAGVQIAKGERGERCIEELRSEVVALLNTTRTENVEETLIHQKKALLALSDIGELLVESFPYDVPSGGKFSYLPRLLGRSRVTFGFRRGSAFLGNVTIIADGFAAPITAGNFVDLSLRQFYTGLGLKTVKKRFNVGAAASTQSVLDDLLAFDLIEEKLGIDDSGPDTVTLPIMGSFNEGFYDPLTGKPRRIPLEIVRVDKSAGTSRLSYSDGFTDLSEASLRPSEEIQPLLSFDIPGLVSWNHPDKNVNVGSSEFFSLQYNTIRPSKRQLFDGRYAPFGYIIDGYDIYQSLRPGDVIESTTVGEWGQLNLVKLRGLASLSDVMQSETD